jgi:hypothetical protein
MAVPLANGDRIGHPVRDRSVQPSSAPAASTTRRLAVQQSSNTPTAATAPDQPGSASDRPNLGWALACAGLLLAAGLLGLTEGGRGRRERRDVRRPRVASKVHAVLRHDAHLLRQR